MTTHLHRQKLNAEQLELLQVANLEDFDRIPVAGFRIAAADGRTVETYKRQVRVSGGCPIDPAHIAPLDDPNLCPLVLEPESARFRCNGLDGDGAHFISYGEWITTLHPAAAERRRHLIENVNVGKPVLVRAFVFELGDQRGVGLYPSDALAEIELRRTRVVRGVVIEASSLEVARQLAGQLHARLPWREDVQLRLDGTLADVEWHGDRLTEIEKVLLREQHMIASRVEHQRRADALRDFEHKLATGQA